MKVLQINSTLNTGSTGRIAEDIGKKLIEAGGQSYIAYGRSANHSLSVPIKIGGKFDQAWHLLNTRLFDSHGFHSTQATKKLIRQIEIIDPDVIHLHNLHGYYLNIRVLFEFLKGFKKPVVWTLHDCWAFTGHCSYFDSIGCDKWKTQCHTCPQKTKYPASYWVDNSVKNFRLKNELFNSIEKLHIVTVSHWLEDLVKKSFLKEKFIQTIHNGVDTSVFMPKTTHEAIKAKYGISNRFIILSVATSWSNRKGIKDLFALNSLLSKDEVIVMVGLTSKQLKKIPQGIIGIKRTENIEELVELYSASDVLISASYEETFGLTIAEAFACGTPAIVYNRTATPEVVSEETGFIVEPKDYNQILSTVEKLKQTGKTKYSIACRNRALNFFNKNSQYSKYIKLYESLILK